MLGQRILPLDGLQAGYRHVSLRTDGNFPLSLSMLFICVELKIYIPDGLGDLMDALSDPRAFLSAQEKRVAQMKAMGIEEADVQTSDLKLGSVKVGGKKDDDKKEEKIEVITQDSLKALKPFQKLRRKQMKDLSSLVKRQQKEKASIQKFQCNAIDKYLKSNKHDNKEMKTRQAKISVETAKEVANDRTLRNKAERERRLREKNSNNTKKFIDERKATAMKQEKERSKLSKSHDKQHSDLVKHTQDEVGIYTNAEVEQKIAAKKVFVV
nr:1-phosphatidylinositol 4,5-bisphosphate phosphodiesterase isoform X3 [Parasteatoda tepidariorum]